MPQRLSRAVFEIQIAKVGGPVGAITRVREAAAQSVQPRALRTEKQLVNLLLRKIRRDLDLPALFPYGQNS